MDYGPAPFIDHKISWIRSRYIYKGDLFPAAATFVLDLFLTDETFFLFFMAQSCFVNNFNGV